MLQRLAKGVGVEFRNVHALNPAARRGVGQQALGHQLGLHLRHPLAVADGFVWDVQARHIGRGMGRVGEAEFGQLETGGVVNRVEAQGAGLRPRQRDLGGLPTQKRYFDVVFVAEALAPVLVEVGVAVHAVQAAVGQVNAKTQRVGAGRKKQGLLGPSQLKHRVVVRGLPVQGRQSHEATLSLQLRQARGLGLPDTQAEPAPAASDRTLKGVHLRRGSTTATYNTAPAKNKTQANLNASMGPHGALTSTMYWMLGSTGWPLTLAGSMGLGPKPA